MINQKNDTMNTAQQTQSYLEQLNAIQGLDNFDKTP